MIKAMRKLFFLILFLPTIAYGRFYLGGGANYTMPMGDFSEVNDASIGYNFQIESRTYCKLWYGLRVDYTKYEELEEIEAGQNYFESGLSFTPQMRYLFLSNRKYDNALMPYLQAGLPISSIGGTDEASRLGLGITAGAGVAFGFGLFNTCWMLDVNARYFAPNLIYKAEERIDLNSVDVSVTLSFCL